MMHFDFETQYTLKIPKPQDLVKINMGFTNGVDYTMIIMGISIEIPVIYDFYLVVNYLRIVSRLYITPVLSVDEKPTCPSG